jgi:hypothetical protein
LQARKQKLPIATDVLFSEIPEREIVMRPVIAVFLTCLALAACGGSERKTVIVNPPPDSTTVIDKNGDAHVVEH